jgi:hypothetical protein
MVPRSFWRRAWPPVALAVAVIVNLAWLGLLVYVLAKVL